MEQAELDVILQKCIEGKSDNILQFNRYGVYNACFDEGANGKINVIFPLGTGV